MVEIINYIALSVIILISFTFLLIDWRKIFKKTNSAIKKNFFILKLYLSVFVFVLSIVALCCNIILEKRSSNTISKLKSDIVEIKPHLKILNVNPSSTQEWPGQLTIKVGSDANQKIDRLRFEIVFENPYIDAKYNYSWDLPSKKGTKYFEPITMATNSKKFVYESEEPLPPGFFLHFIFTSELPLIIESTNLSP